MRENATRVAVIVHNSVIKDARVLKEVKTLWESGLAVDVYGVKTDREVMAKKIEGCRSFTLIDLTSRCTKLGYQFHIYKIILRSVNAVNKFRNDLKKIVKGSSGVLFGLIAVLAGVFIGGSSDPGKFSLLVLMFLSLLLIAYAAWPLLFEKVGYVKRKAAFERVGGALFNAIKSEEYDYVHCHDLIALIPGLRYKKENPSVKLIWDAHELYDEVAYSSCMERVYIRELMRTASRKIDSFVTISDSFKEIYAQKFPRLPSASVVMNATMLNYDGSRKGGYSSDSCSENKIKKTLGLEGSQKVLLFQGGFSPGRGIEVLLEAASDLPPYWTIVFMGWGKLEDMISHVSSKLNQGREQGRSAVELLPPVSQDNLVAWTSGATLGVIPYENTSLNHLYCTPNKLWEYPNAGVPILATDLIEMGKMIRAWDIGTLLPRDFSASDVLSALENINEDDLARWRKNCERFSSEMSWSKFEPALLEAYQ